MHENINLNNPNFCIGPQAGTYCSIDNDVDPVVMHVKNELGNLIRTYSFFPSGVLEPGPYTYSSASLPGPDGYIYNEFVKLKYVGPRDQSMYFDGAVFYTLEKRAHRIRTYYTYERDPDPYGPYKMDMFGHAISYPRPEPYDAYGIANISGTLYDDWRPEYNSNIIRRWKLDTANSRLELNQTIIKNSDSTDWFNANTFTVHNSVLPMTAHSANGSQQIEMTTSSGLKKYDVLMLGPSSDTDNIGAIEEVYVHSIIGNTVTVKTYEGYIPPKYDYMSGDMVTSFKDILLFSDPAPVINSENIAYDYVSTSGTLYHLDQTDYGEVIHRYYSGVYGEVFNSAWNQEFDSLSFVKGTNLLHLSLDDYEIKLSQNIGLNYPSAGDTIYLHDLDIKGVTIYKLQRQIIQRDDAGTYVLMSWLTYNYHKDSLIPYSCSVSMEASDKILMQSGITYIIVTVRDQFGVTLLNKNVWFTTEGDSGSSIIPMDGYAVTDANGNAELRYDAGTLIDAETSIFAKVDGSNVTHGSAYIVAVLYLSQYSEWFTELNLMSLETQEAAVQIATRKYIITYLGGGAPDVFEFPPATYDGSVILTPRVSYMFPDNKLLKDSDWQNYDEPHPPILLTHIAPMFNEKFGGGDPPIQALVEIELYITKLLLCSNDSGWNLLGKVELKISTDGEKQTEQYLSQNVVSRHLLTGHMDNVSLNQFQFIQEAIPAMWSEKNNVDTDYWIRLRPFANDLNPDTLIIKFKEHSYLDTDFWYDVTDEGTITMFDAGGGLLGIDFFYNPPINFHHNAIVYVSIEVYDFAGVPNKITVDYWFKLIQDYSSPYIENHFPPIEGFGIPINTNITFDLLDVGEGVDITTLEVFVNERSTIFTYDEFEHGNYHITCDLSYIFHYGQTVSIIVDVRDRSDNANRLYDGWKFYCSESTGPWFNGDNTDPERCLEGAEITQDVSMQVYGINDTGIEYNSIKVEIGGRYRNIKIIPIVYRLS